MTTDNIENEQLGAETEAALCNDCGDRLNANEMLETDLKRFEHYSRLSHDIAADFDTAVDVIATTDDIHGKDAILLQALRDLSVNVHRLSWGLGDVILSRFNSASTDLVEE